MNDYIATFHTHFSALASRKNLAAAGVESRMTPVPRALSSSCGVCLRYSAETPLDGLMHRDMERIVLARGDGYETVVAGAQP